jgi:uncharacterized protein
MIQKIITALLLCATLILTGCSNLQARSAQSLSAATYLQMAATAGFPLKQRYLIQAADRYTQDHAFSQAQNILSQLNISILPPELQIQYQLASARLLIFQHENAQALNILNGLSSNNGLMPSDQYRLNELLALTYQGLNLPLKAINALNNLLNVTTDDIQHKAVLIQTWSYLQTLPPKTLLALTKAPNINMIQSGWLQLMIIAEQPDNSALIQELHIWQAQYANHPAKPLIQLEFNTQTQSLIKAPSQITLMLPLKGPLGGPGMAIRNGFFAAYYYAKKQGQATPTIRVLDTSDGHIGMLYRQALASGSQFIVGPLSKNNVQTLTQNNLSVPTLALNSLANSSVQPNLYQFGLSPLDETKQIATRAWQDGHTRALIMAPNSAWGQALAQSFTGHWQQQGGQVVTSLYFDSTHQLSDQIQQVLGITAAQSRYSALKRTLYEKVRFTPWRRQDIDMVFLAAQPSRARQVRPLMKFYYAGDVPVYAISTIYPGTPGTALDRDLNGITFPDMPFVILKPSTLPQNLQAIRNNIQALWPKSFKRYIKLYALGIDAFDLINKLSKLSVLPQFGVYGATGRLYLTQNQHIYRRLMWATMERSVPKAAINE